MQEGEWLTWLVVQHISDVVLLHTEPPVHTLLQSIHSSPAASALLIQAIHARCDYVHKVMRQTVLLIYFCYFICYFIDFFTLLGLLI